MHITFENLLKNIWANFNLNWYKVFVGKKNSNLFKWRAMHLLRGDNSYIVKIHWRLILQNHLANLTKLGTEHPWVKGIKFLQIKDLTLFLRGDNSNKLKIYLQLLKVFSRTAGPISTKHDTKYSWIKGIQICSN